MADVESSTSPTPKTSSLSLPSTVISSEEGRGTSLEAVIPPETVKSSANEAHNDEDDEDVVEINLFGGNRKKRLLPGFSFSQPQRQKRKKKSNKQPKPLQNLCFWIPHEIEDVPAQVWEDLVRSLGGNIASSFTADGDGKVTHVISTSAHVEGGKHGLDIARTSDVFIVSKEFVSKFLCCMLLFAATLCA